jgi:lysosomal Pro-X carboxypeptidase
VYTGNESLMDLFVDNTGYMFDIAPKFGVLLVFIEVYLRIWHLVPLIVI